jgi:23S rRNA (adenine2503-C2)-methyltransferase
MIEEFSLKYKLPKYRIEQFNQQFYRQAIGSFDELSNWSKDLREKLKAEIDFMSLEVDKKFVAQDGKTIKVLFTRKLDGQRIETVLMRHRDGRNTVCVSCMVGCPVNCSFCATGKMGFGGNLTHQEIVDQVMYFQRYLFKLGEAEEPRITNVVYMGMGEPMLNLKAVEDSFNTFTNPEKLAMGARRFTISTSGYIPQLKQLIATGYRGKIAISLHAPNQALRETLMPVAKLYSLDKLMAELDEYVTLTNKRISYEYILIKGVNDLPEHAEELVEMFKHRLHHLNLIPYNPIREVAFERSTSEEIRTFTSILAASGINYTIRVTMGDDVNAACGQLADRENQAHQHKKIK